MAKSNRIKVIYKKLGREKAYGLADHEAIHIDTRLKGKKHLEIMIHESLHYIYPDKSEEDIVADSIKLTNTLWHDGYRKVDNQNDDKLQDGTK